MTYSAVGEFSVQCLATSMSHYYLLLLLTENWVLHGGSGTTIRHNTQIKHHTQKKKTVHTDNKKQAV
jgi:hypothetical protein